MKRVSIRGIRHLSITQPPLVTVPSTVDLADAVQNVQEIQASGVDGDEPQFQTLGLPPVLLSLNLPAAAPVYIKKGSLVSLYGLHNQKGTNTTTPLSLANVTKQMTVISPLRRTLLGGFSFTYEKLTSAVPFSLVVSSAARSILNPWRRSGGKTFATLTLDGRMDWAVFPTDAVQLYSGESLKISHNVAPRAATTTMLQRLSLKDPAPTGLFSWFRAGYTFLSGRGYVGLVGNGQVYRIQLRAAEEIMVAKKSLLAMSIAGPGDLANSVVQQSLSSNTTEELAAIEQKRVESQIQVSADEAMAPSKAKEVTMAVWAALKRFTSFFRSETASFVSGSTDYVKIVGPRTILFQSAQHTEGSVSSHSFHDRVAATESAMAAQNPKLPQEASKPAVTPEDFLSYASVKNGKVEFRSTKDFSETVSRLEAHTKV